MSRQLFSIAIMSFLLAAACGKQEASTPEFAPGDKIFVNGRIYTANEDRAFATGMIVRGDEVVGLFDSKFVGGAFDNDSIELIDLGGRLVLPGLHDAHIHPISAMPVESCSLLNTPTTLADISAFASECTARPGMGGDWLVVISWNYSAGNQPGPEFSTIREALDAVSTEKPVILRGSDGHHFAVNSVALARAKNAAGEQVGFSAATLASDFAELAPYVGVDESGEPNGRLTEDYALDIIGAGNFLDDGIARRRAAPELMMKVTLPRGITSFMDAAANPKTLDIYDALIAKGEFKARAHLSLYFEPGEYAGDNGAIDYGALLSEAKAIREKYADNPLIEADFLKLFADGVLEGDPLSDPPTLPNAAFSHTFLQPIYAWDEDEQWVKVAGYVDLASETCVDVRARLARGETVDAPSFKAANGYHPLQCIESNGVLQHPEQTIMDYVREGDAAGFTFHIHAISDRSVTTALNAIEAARAANHSGLKPIITHLQLVAPEDIARFAENDAYASFTFAWAIVDPQYDTTVMPFIDDVTGPNGIYNPDGYYWKNVYPAESIRKAGGVVIAGSDAPVDTADPRPFINIEAAVRRSRTDLQPLNGNEAISIEDAVDAYTINAAKAMKQDDIAGSLEPGKKADFIILDRDIFDLANTGHAADISETKVLETWFGGEKVYAAGD
ncbi:MAG: amidohydrolase family protein [Parvularculaceae bacterium]